MHETLQLVQRSLGVELGWRGDAGLLDTARRVLLVSRAERRPQPADAWVRSLVAETNALLARGETLVAGSGREAYDLPLLRCVEACGAAIVASLRDEPPPFIPARVLQVFPRARPPRDAALLLRDRLAGALADRATCIAVRTGGHMAQLAEELRARGCAVDNAARPGALTTPKRQRPFDVTHRPVAWPYLTHFTREPDGAWPGESAAEYLNWLGSGPAAPPRDARASLERILREGRVRACGRLIRGGTPSVCFTALKPADALALNRWRKGLRRWRFTPYGIAVEREALMKLGARAVEYSTALGNLAWADEQEWRIAGDVLLRDLPTAAVRVLVPHRTEAAELRGVSPWPVEALG